MVPHNVLLACQRSDPNHNILIHRPFAAAAPVQKNPKEWGGGDFKVIFQSKGIHNWFYAISLRKFLPTFGVLGTNPN